MAIQNQAGQKRKRIANIPKQSKRPRDRTATYHSSSSEEEVELAIDRASLVGSKKRTRLPAGAAPTKSLEPSIALTGVVGRSKKSISNVDVDEEEIELEADDMVASSDGDDSEDQENDEFSDLGSILSDESASTATRERLIRKRNDPSVFASSISKILGAKLTTTQRTDPILARSKDASTTVQQQTDARLTAKAKRKMKEDKRTTLEKGREKDLLGLDRADVTTGEIIEKEKQLRRTAQKGVVKLFNAVRAAQVMSSEAERGEKQKGTVGMDKRKERVEDMGKKAFLDLLVDGGAV